jgi:hypothetical protein
MNLVLLSHQTFSRLIAFAVGLAIVAVYALPLQFAQAAAITAAFDTMSNLTVSATSTHALNFVSPTGANQNTDTIEITFPSDFNFTGKTIGTVSFTHGATTGLEATETLAASPSATAWGAVFSGTQNRILTLTAPTDGTGAAVLAPSDKIIISYTGANSVNPTTPGSYAIAVAGTFGDTGSITVNILTNSQVSITATVPQSLTFSVSDNSISFGTLSAAGARHASGTANGQSTEVEAHNLIVGTNASNGYTMTVAGNTLTSGANTITAIGASNVASSVGTEQFGMRMSASGGTGAVAVPYAAAGFALDTAAFPDIVATASGSSANTTYSARYIANITSSTEAGAYTSTLTYVATANF